MKNYISDGDTITVAAPANLSSGDGVLIGAMFGVAAGTVTSGDQVAVLLEGVFTLPKVGSQAWTVGAKVYWDATNKQCTTVATGNTLIGVATAAVANGAGDTSGTVRLNGTV